MTSSTRSSLLLWGICVLYLLMALWLWSFTAEDAYIVYRYSENFATGHGLVFNRGEAVCALTSPLHALLCTSLYAVTKATVTASKIAGVLAVLAAFLFAVRTELSHEQDRLWAGTLILLSPFLVLWTVGGLETPFLAALAMLALSLARQCKLAPNRMNATSLSIVLGLLVLTRFDAVLLAFPLYLSVLVERFRRPAGGHADEEGNHRPGADARHFWFSEFLCLTFPGLLIVVTWLLSAWSYYGDVLPTSFYHKGPSVSSERIIANLIYVGQFVFLSGLLVLILLRQSGRRERPKKSAGDNHTEISSRLGSNWGGWLGIVLLTGYASLTATTHMMFGYRMLVPYLPVVVILILQARPTDATRAKSTPWPLRCGMVIVVAQLTLLVVIDRWSLNPGVIGEYRKLSRRDYVEFLETLEKQASAIRGHWRRWSGRSHEPPRIFTYAAGLVSYRLPNAHILDSGLISFRHKFRNEPSGIRSSADYILILTPRHGQRDNQLGKTVAVQGFERIIEIEQSFDGSQETFEVYFNRAPTKKRLSKRVR